MLCTYDGLIRRKHEGRDDLGASSDGGTPVPISNTAVKPVSSDGTWTQPGPGRVARRQDHTVLHANAPMNFGAFVFAYFAECARMTKKAIFGIISAMTLTKAQKKYLVRRSKFWAVHAGHWLIAFGFFTIACSLIYLFFAQDRAFAAAFYGR